MGKPTLLYASPFPPMASGISDYSIALVRALAKKFDITLYTGDYDISEKSVITFPVVKHGVDRIDFKKYEYVIYNMGNNVDFHDYIYEAALEHEGCVIQHDLVLFHFIHGYYREKKDQYFTTLYKKFGIEEFIEIREAIKEGRFDFKLASKLPLCTELLKSGNRFIVHSQYTRNKLLQTGMIEEEKIKQINMIEQIHEDESLVPREQLLRKFKIPQDALLVCAFGYIQGTKLNRETCHVLRDLARTHDQKICYVMVGCGEYVNDELEKDLIIKTGYTELDEFNSFVQYADIVINLRNPTMGETSGSMLRILQLGKPCITNNGGWFSELPDDCVCKIDLDDVEANLRQSLLHLVNYPEERCKISSKAREYMAAHYQKEAIAEQFYEFITSGR